ncbi:MAG TPA: acyltransferase [Polyangia bacterium]
MGTGPSGSADHRRIVPLDGWRGISISLVLAAHLLPLGPARFQLNATAGPMGMSIFFTLSGYLITAFLLERPDVKTFLIRRFLRILPLAWGVLFVLQLLPFSRQAPDDFAASLLFYQNLHYASTTDYNSHFWSLCVEMQFYVGAAVIVGLGGRRALRVLPFIALAVSGLRIYLNQPVAVATYGRIDEILAGATLALALGGEIDERLLVPLRRISPAVFALFLLLTSSPLTGRLNGLRAWAGAMLVGSTLLQQEHWLARPLRSRLLHYLATISYALYVIHGPLRCGWFSEGNTVGRYLIRRPLTLLLSFALAHLSTFYWEARWIELGRRLTRRRAPPAVVPG